MNVFQDIFLVLDKPLFSFIQLWQTVPFFNFLFAWPSFLGELRVLVPIVALTVIIFDWGWHGILRVPVIIAGLYATHFGTMYLKLAFARPRPWEIWASTDVIGPKPGDYAFPSGHTSLVFTAAFLLAYYYPRRMRWTFWLAALIGFTRIYRGVHYPTDILGGIATGIGIGCLVAMLFYPFGIHPPESDHHKL
jgi:undecaprenyl-diphosphatase